jgi:SNF2 family DNA or RNA helicase
MGQTKPVTIYRLVTEGTVDEVILQMSVAKKRLGEQVLGDNNGKRVVTGDLSMATTSMADIIEKLLET